MKSYDVDWQRQDDTITISKSYFEHLLNCLANQKFVEELPTNGDAIETGENEYRNIQKENQDVIDKAWREGMFILSLNSRIDSEVKDDRARYLSFVEKNYNDIDNIIDAENEKYKIGQVTIDDFNEIVRRRGFTPRIVSFLKKALKASGIGEGL